MAETESKNAAHREKLENWTSRLYHQVAETVDTSLTEHRAYITSDMSHSIELMRQTCLNERQMTEELY